MRITVLSPHRDDAAFSVGLTIGIWLGLGHEVHVVNCFTTSEYSPFGDVSAIHADDLGSHVTTLRHAEDVLWSRTYHPAAALTDLGLVDAPERLHCSVDEVCGIPVLTDDDAMKEIRRALEGKMMDVLVLPLGIGDHVDHLTARLAAQDGWPADFPMAFYEDLPYSARPGGAEGIELRVNSVTSGLQGWFVSSAVDQADAVERKRRFALCYGSQIDDAVVDQIAKFCERYNGRERLWVNEAWREMPS